MFKFVMMKTKLVIILIILLLTNSKNYGQVNLVQNPSFEQLGYLDTSQSCSSIDASSPWHFSDSMVMYNGPYLMLADNKINHTCHLPIPASNWGGVYQYPRTGKVCAIGIEYEDSFGQAYRNYAIGVLNSPLTNKVTYCVTFYTNVAKPISNGIAIDHIGAYISNNSIDTVHNNGMVISRIPQVECSGIISDTMNWTMVQGSYYAQGGETRITLGNFYYNYQTHLYHFPGGGVNGIEYFFDDVSVVESTAKIFAGNDTTITIGDTVVLGLNTTLGLPCEWYDIQGNKIAASSIATVIPTTTTKYVVRMDLCGTISYDTMTVYAYPLGVNTVSANQSSLEVYPNPANTNLTISQFENDRSV